MLVKLTDELCRNSAIELRKYVTVNASREEDSRGAFPSCAVIDFSLSCPRVFGVTGAVLSILRDGEEPKELPLSRELFARSFRFFSSRRACFSPLRVL